MNMNQRVQQLTATVLGCSIVAFLLLTPNALGEVFIGPSNETNRLIVATNEAIIIHAISFSSYYGAGAAIVLPGASYGFKMTLDPITALPGP
jgi:hypothetical protein